MARNLQCDCREHENRFTGGQIGGRGGTHHRDCICAYYWGDKRGKEWHVDLLITADR